jgi:hypothetical protein
MHTRIRTAAVGVSGLLTLSALAAPAAQAAPADAAASDTTISDVVVNGGKSIVLGSSGKATVTVKMTVSDPSGISDAGGILYHGQDVTHNDWGVVLPICGKHPQATYTCSLTDTVDAVKNAHAGTWKIWAYANGIDGDYIQKDPAKTFKVLRAAQLSANAAPEPVKKGATITVTGTLTVANWETHKYGGYRSQKVALQFRKTGTKNYVNVKGITSSSTGSLKTTVKAASDGYWRFTYAGSPTAAPVTSTGDYVDVR